MIKQQPELPDISEARKMPNWVPWTTQQVFSAVLLTLIPWISFNLVLSALGSNATLQKPLSFSDDLGGAIIQFIFTALIEGAFLIVPYYYTNKALTDQTLAEAGTRWRARMQALGLRRFKVTPTLPWIVGLMALIIGVNLLYAFFVARLHLNIQTNDQVVLNEGKYAPLITYSILLGSVIIAPFCEEIFFRGLVLPGLLHELSPAWAIVVSAALFAIAHTDPGSFLPLFVIGSCLGFLRLRTGSTWASISLHVLNNLLSSLLIILSMHNITLPF